VVACAVAAIGDLDQVFDLAGLAVPPTTEYLRVIVMRQAQPDPTALSQLDMLLPALCTFWPWALACS
jgi:hypothetical protein